MKLNSQFLILKADPQGNENSDHTMIEAMTKPMITPRMTPMITPRMTPMITARMTIDKWYTKNAKIPFLILISLVALIQIIF